MQNLRQLKQQLKSINTMVLFEFPTKGPVVETMRAVDSKRGTPYDNHMVTVYHSIEKYCGRQFKRWKMLKIFFLQN